MTGFGCAEENGCRVEIRSLNSRFLDIHVKAPSFLNQFDIPLRNLLKARFARGKFDVAISVSENVSSDVRVNTETVARLCDVLRKLQKELSLSGEIDINMIAGFHQLYLQVENIAFDADTLYDVFKRAMDNLAEMRNREGRGLTEELIKMVDALSGMNDRIKYLKGDVMREITEKFNDKLKQLLGEKEFDSNRVLQEAALLAMKLDISEEIARIDSHVKQFRDIVLQDEVIGRTLDFIVQELNREINTVTSKSADYAITSLTVEMKALTEKMKEQVQNIQ
jgi:uncharacterized protein (TIGR00255 family)